MTVCRSSIIVNWLVLTALILCVHTTVDAQTATTIINPLSGVAIWDIAFYQGNVYIASGAGVQKLTTDGSVVLTTYSSSQYDHIAVDLSGIVYGLTTTTVSLWYNSGPFYASYTFPSPINPSGITVDSANNIYVSQYFFQIIKISWSLTSQLYVFSTSNPYLSQSSGTITFDSSDNLYVADTFNSRIVKFNPNGLYTVFDVNGGHPYGVAVDSAGNIYVAAYSSLVLKYNSGGMLIGQFTAASFTTFITVAVDSLMNVYATAGDGNGFVIFSQLTYSWVITSQGACSLTCGGGIKNVNYTCHDPNGGIATMRSFCGAAPISTMACNTQACVPPSNQSSSGLSTLDLGLIIVGSIIGVLILLFALWWYYCRSDSVRVQPVVNVSTVNQKHQTVELVKNQTSNI